MEEPIELASLLRNKYKNWYGNNPGKASLVVCNNINPSWCKKFKCSKCKVDCYVSESSENYIGIKTKLVCNKCALKFYKKQLNKEQINIIEAALERKY